jgi:hypothetical protein
MELLVLIPVALVVAPIILGLFTAVAAILFSIIVASGGLFFVVANEVANNRMPAFMLLFAFGIALIFIPLVLMAIRGSVGGAKKAIAYGKVKAAEINNSGKKPAKNKKTKPDEMPESHPKKTRFILPGLIGLGAACVVGAITISALSRQPFWPALQDSFLFQRAERKHVQFTAADVQKIIVDVHNEPITVRVDSNVSEVNVHYSDIADRKAIQVELSDGALTVREDRNYRWVNFAFYVEHTEVEIVVPANFLATYDLDTSNGRIVADGITTDELLANTSNGRVELLNVEAKKVDIKTSNGRIVLSKLASENVRLKTSNGRIEGSVDGSKSDFNFNLKTSNGRVELNGEDFDNSHTSSGNKFPFEAITSNGRIELTFND